MTYEEKLTAVIQTLTGSPEFVPAEDAQHANYRITDATFPLVLKLPNGVSAVDRKANTITQNMGIALCFCDLVAVDVAYSVKRAIWDRMYLLGCEFLIKAGLISYFQYPTEVTSEEVSDVYDENVCGVVFFMKLQELTGPNVCDLSKMPPTVKTANALISSIVLVFSKPMNEDVSLSSWVLWIDGIQRTIVDREFVDSDRCAILFDPPAISSGQYIQMAITSGLLASDGTVFQGATFTVKNNVV